MAEKEVQNVAHNSKTAVSAAKTAVSPVSGSKKTPATASSSKASVSSETVSSITTKLSTKESAPSSGSLKEVGEILRVINSNMKAQNERMDKQDKRIDEFMSQWNEYPYDEQNEGYEYDYEEETSSVYEPQHESEQVHGEAGESKSIFKKLSDKFRQNEQVDSDVDPDLASLVNNSFRNGLSDESLEEISKQTHRPQNCDSLVKTRVNQGIWRLLKSFTQAEDSRMTAIQGVLLKASINVVKLVEKLGAAGSEHVELGTTAIALLGHINKMINIKRKDLHKTDLDYKYHYLASASLPYTDLLYGNDTDVNNNVREINNMNRIGRGSGRGGPMRGFGRGRRGYSPYPARGRGFHGRGRGFPPARPDMGAKNQRPPQKK